MNENDIGSLKQQRPLVQLVEATPTLVQLAEATSVKAEPHSDQQLRW